MASKSSPSEWEVQVVEAKQRLANLYVEVEVAPERGSLAIWHMAHLKKVYQAWTEGMTPADRKARDEVKAKSVVVADELGDPDLVWIPEFSSKPSSRIEIGSLSRQLLDAWSDHPQTQAVGYPNPSVYLPRETWSFGYRQLNRAYDAPFIVFPLPSQLCPFPVCTAADPSYRWRRGNPRCDVYYHDPVEHADPTSCPLPAGLHQQLKRYTKKRARATQDFPVPNYQNLIDPNMYLHEHKWVATDWLVEQRGSQLSASYLGPIYDFDPRKHPDLYRPVHGIMEASLPLLAKLRRPALVLPGPLQTVVKVQKIYLEPGEEYEGVWHRDGDGVNEKIVAVILYYYRHDTPQEGGQLEFLDKTPLRPSFWVGGDCSPDDYPPAAAQSDINSLPQCKVPVKEGTLVVFSNYQMIHRVLRMRNPTAKTMARSFVCMFVVDQRSPLQSSSDPIPMLSISKLDAPQRKEMRGERLLQQLQPAGRFGAHDVVYSTGNGSATLLGWMENKSNNSRDIREMLKCSRYRDRSGLFCLGAINLCPPMHRGVSWAASFRLHFQNTVGSLQVLAWRAIQENAIDTSGLPFHVRDSLEWFRMHDQVIEQCGREAYDHLVEEEQTRLRRAEKTEALLSRRRRMIQNRTN